MPELRWNPLFRQWVAMSPGRLGRPGSDEELAAAIDPHTQPDYDSNCPFCPGNEARTPPEVWADRSGGSAPDSVGWTARSVPNLYPVVEPPDGYHEVLVHSPSHSKRIEDMADDEAAGLTRAWAARIRGLAAHAGVASVLVTVNQGRAAGASVAHPHSQLVAVRFGLPPVEAESEALSAAGSCPLCEFSAGPRAEGLSFENPGAPGGFAVCPPWSVLPYEVLIAPSDHDSHFEADDGRSRWLGPVLRRCLKGLAAVTGGAAYNVALHSSGLGKPQTGFHWHVHIWPRLSQFAGIEIGGGIPVCTVDPAEAATRINEALAKG